MKNINKKHLIIALTGLLIATSQSSVFAIQDSKVISDSEKQKELLNSFEEVNQYTNTFFTPKIQKTKKDIDTPIYPVGLGFVETPSMPSCKATPPLKEFRIKLKSYIEKRENKNISLPKDDIEAPKEQNQVILNCEEMEYFADRTELEANGNVVMYFPESNSTLKADKLVYNQYSNLIKAFGNVVLINDGKEMFGDYLQVDMNEENALMDNPISDVMSMQIHSKKGYMYGDEIIQEQGKILATKHKMLDIRAEMFGPDIDNLFVEKKNKSYFMKENHGSKFKIKTNDLIINSKKEHDTVTFKKAEIYFDDKKLGTIPSITIHSDKAQSYIEADYPEIGTMSNLGMYAGPGFVFDTPHASTLKVLPILNYQSDSANPDGTKLGWGAVAKFKSATNKTDFAYGTANKVFIMRGIQYLDDNLFLQYAANSYVDDWFMGFRMPKLMGEMVYQDAYTKSDFLGENRPLTYTQRIAGAYVQDGVPGGTAKLGEDGVGTLRVKYMNEIAQTFYKYKDLNTSPINGIFDLVAQGAVTAYGTGDTQMIARIGPRIHSQYKNWMQDVGYFLSAYDDKTPLVHFDRYMYGRSNVYMRETYRLCKYLTLSWMGSLNMSGDAPDGNMIQENTFFFGIGPDDVRINIGYDTVRQQSFVTMALHLDTKGSSIEYNKMIIKNYDTLGKSPKGENKNSFSSSNQNENINNVENEDEDNVIDSDGEEPINQIEHAEVINISQEVDGL